MPTPEPSTPSNPRRTSLLPLDVRRRPGRRAQLTCRYRCGNACEHPPPNPTDNPYIGEIVEATISRRTMFRATGTLGVLGLVGGAGALAACSPTPAPGPGPGGGPVSGPPAAGLAFTSVAPNTADAISIPDGYVQQVVLRWGEPIVAGAPAFAPTAQTAAAQAGQFGYNNDFLGLLPGPDGQLLLVANHEYTNEELMFAGYNPDSPTREQVEIAMAAHGLSVVVLDQQSGPGLTVAAGHPLNRRITATTPHQVTGPAAGSALLRTSADPAGTTVLGTLNNCAGGLTPWGTVLSAEENFNQYFGNASAVTEPIAAAALARYGLKGEASERKWELFDKRFDLAQEPNEANRFGWIVELDPNDPTSVPRKRTALGRFKHEAAQPRITADGRVAVYMGDDEKFDYVYKFVSTGTADLGTGPDARQRNMALLDDGTLYVARFTGAVPAPAFDGSGALPPDGAFDGTGEWIPLARGTESLVPGMSAEEVYVFTRLAADKVGATKMDRPEDVEPHPRTGVVYLALTNNDGRGTAGKAAADEANPRNENKHGQVLELTDEGGDAAATTFGWRLFLVCGDPADPGTYYAGFPKDQVSPISCPDNLAFDDAGNLWISTDGNALDSNDGLFGVAVEGPRRGEVKQFLTVPVGAETCGPVIQRDRVLVAVQHPGEKDGANVEQPASSWPDGAGNLVRPSVVVVHRGGDPIGA
ncbi:MAG: PhoX family protein [Pseudonocardia sp.]